MKKFFKRNKTLVYRLIIFTFLFLIALISILFLAVYLQVFGPVPSKNDLANIQHYNASEIFAEDGELLGKYFLFDRTSVSLDDVSSLVTDALIATEDVRFYRHNGIDLRSLGRVIVKNLLLGNESAGGGSTISMQLAKNLYPRNHKSFFGLITEKIREGIVARRLEKVYSKDNILLLYLNTVPFGDNVFGIASASQRFFNKKAGDLLIEEAAVLIGMLKASTFYNPRLHPENALLRRNTVIDQLSRYKYIECEVADSLKMLPLQLNYTPLSHVHGPAPYFREWLRQELIHWIDGYNAQHSTQLNLYTDGLKIYTTIDYTLQQQAEKAMKERMAYLQDIMNKRYTSLSVRGREHLINQQMKRSKRYVNMKNSGRTEQEIAAAFTEAISMTVFDWEGEKIAHLSPRDSLLMAQKTLHGALVSIEASSGHIKAWVGGNDYRFFQFDNVLTSRQPGSAFKPFVYATALEKGFNPCEYVSSDTIVFHEYNDWSPSNADGHYQGYYSMKGALTHSVNTVTARYLKKTGMDALITMANRSGIEISSPGVPSLALGTLEVSLLDMTAAYGIFSHWSVAPNPGCLLSIEDKHGQILYASSIPEVKERVLSEDHARMITEMLKNVTASGTAAAVGQRLSAYMDVAGKTGTTQNNADSWFIGYTPKMITGIWIGIENPAFATVFTPPFGAGGSAALLWRDYMLAGYQDSTTKDLISGRYEPIPDHIAAFMDCPDFVIDLPGSSWIERLFGRPEEKDGQDSEDQEKQPRRRGLLRRILDELFD